MKNKEINWLYDQLPDLVDKEVISESVAASLKNHYGAVEKEDASASSNLSIVITSSIGAILVGSGIIAILAYNWDNLGRPFRTVVSILPLLIAQIIYGYAFLKKRNSVSWMESSSGFLALMLLSSMALISQTYNLGGNLTDLLTAWAILMIPILYLKRVTVPFVIFMICISWITFDKMDYLGSQLNILYTYSAFILAIAPYLYIVFKNGTRSTSRSITGWVMAIGLLITVPFIFRSGDGEIAIVYGVLLSFIYLAGKNLYPDQDHFTIRIALLGTYVLGMLYSFNWLGKYQLQHIQYGIPFIITCAVFGVFALIFAARLIRKGEYINPFPAIIFLMTIVWQILFEQGYHIIAQIIADAFILAFGIKYIYDGLNAKKMFLINMGMFFIVSLACARFFESEINFLVKGVAFIIVGIGFLAANIFINRKLKDNAL